MDPLTSNGISLVSAPLDLPSTQPRSPWRGTPDFSSCEPCPEGQVRDPRCPTPRRSEIRRRSCWGWWCWNLGSPTFRYLQPLGFGWTHNSKMVSFFSRSSEASIVSGLFLQNCWKMFGSLLHLLEDVSSNLFGFIIYIHNVYTMLLCWTCFQMRLDHTYTWLRKTLSSISTTFRSHEFSSAKESGFRNEKQPRCVQLELATCRRGLFVSNLDIYGQLGCLLPSDSKWQFSQQIFISSCVVAHVNMWAHVFNLISSDPISQDQW